MPCCPKCESKKIKYSVGDGSNKSTVYLTCACIECGNKWTKVYKAFNNYGWDEFKLDS